MWAREVSLETTASPAAIWRLWSNVDGWPEWNGDIEHIEIDGEFATGSRISMTPIGQEAVELSIVEVVENELFVDEVDLGDALIRTVHRLDRCGEDRMRVIYRMQITGTAADELGPQLGPKITADFPQTLAALVQRAQR